MKALLTLWLILSTALLAATDSELERAYAKEFAFLKAQKEMLQKRLESVTSQQEKQIASAKKELMQLQNLVLKKNAQSEQRAESLFHAQQNAQNVSDDTSLIEAVVMQSSTMLRPYGIDVAIDKENYPMTLESLFAEAGKLIATLESIRSEAGAFYLADGTEKEGTLIKVGNIATYGVAGESAGALVPAGEQKFKLWNAPEAAESAQALASNSLPASLNVFVYENAASEIADKTEKSTVDVINSGGLIGWVIVALGVIGLLLSLLRILFLSQASTTTDTLAKESLAKLLDEGSEKALEFLKEKSGSTARVIKATIRNLDRDREHIEDIVAESILHESGRLDRFGSAVMVIAAVAPLLGLLGTVTGMIATFDIITEFGTGDPKLLSGGISIALVTTELGLIIAIPLLLVGNLLSGWAEKVKDSMEHSALHIINEYNKQK